MPDVAELQDWLSVQEVAIRATRITRSATTASQLLRMACDGGLRLSVFLPSGTIAALPENATYPAGYDQRIEGLWDLPMRGVAKQEVERRYGEWSGGDAIDLSFGRYAPGALVTKGAKRRILMCTPRYIHPRASYTAIPEATGYVVKRREVERLFARLKPEETPSSKQSLGTKEKTTLLLLVAVLAGRAKCDLSKPHAAGERISGWAAEMGVSLSPNTVAKWVDHVPEALERRATK